MVRRYFVRFAAVMTFLLTLQTAHAQYVNIPDGNLVNMLNNQYPGCMSGSMLDTTCASIVNATVVDLHGNYIADFTGIQYFDNADTLILEFNMASSLPPLPSGLSYFNANANQLTSLPALPNGLVQLHVNNNYLTSLPALPSTLITVDCFGNELASLPALPTGLLVLSCDVNNLTALPALPNGMISLSAAANQLTSLPSLPDSLQALVVSQNQLTSLPSLPTANFVYLNADYNQLVALPDLPNVINALVVNNNPDLTCLPPVSEVTYMMDISNTSITCLPNVIQHPGSWPQIDTMPLCGPGGTGCPVAWNITGYAFLDANGNCIMDTAESPLGNVKMTLHQGAALLQQVYTNTNGLYAFDTDLSGMFTVSIDTTDLPYNVTCPSGNSYTTNITALDSMDNNAYFGLVCQPGFDVGVTSVVLDSGLLFPAQGSIVNVHAGGIATIYGPACNIAGIAGTLSVTLNGPVSYQGTPAGAVPPTVVTGNTLTWNIADFSTVDFYHDFRIALVTDTFTTMNQLCVEVNVVAFGPMADNNPSNNSLQHCFAVGNSYDPNFKEAYPIATTAPNEWITYTVHFQNTGTAPAINIVLRDTLDTNLEQSSFTYLAASHGVVTNVQEGGIAVFEFPNIFLADSNSNEPESHGWVQYKIKTKASIIDPTTIYNSASIYFDFNTPVMTNTTENVYGVTSTETVEANENVLQLFPNPANQSVTLFHQGVSADASIVISDVTGRIVSSQAVANASSTVISLNDFAQGVYTVQLTDNNKRVDQRKLIVIK